MKTDEFAKNEAVLAEYEKLRERLFDSNDVEAQNRLAELDTQFIEDAPWFGTTGLGEETERRLPQYIRMEYGETVFNGAGLKAGDLQYIGRYSTEQGPTHFWKLPSGRRQQQYAFVVEFEDCNSLGFGRDLVPPEDNSVLDAVHLSESSPQGGMLTITHVPNESRQDEGAAIEILRLTYERKEERGLQYIDHTPVELPNGEKIVVVSEFTKYGNHFTARQNMKKICSFRSDGDMRLFFHTFGGFGLYVTCEKD